jgi:MtN3 and saliva related transmembrane protein
MNIVTAIGLLAAACSTLAFIPQAIKTLRTKNTRDLSLGMYVLIVSGTTLWLTYGLLLGDTPIILANSCILVFSVLILVMKVKHK